MKSQQKLGLHPYWRVVEEEWWWWWWGAIPAAGVSSTLPTALALLDERRRGCERSARKEAGRSCRVCFVFLMKLLRRFFSVQEDCVFRDGRQVYRDRISVQNSFTSIIYCTTFATVAMALPPQFGCAGNCITTTKVCTVCTWHRWCTFNHLARAGRVSRKWQVRKE